MPPIPSAARVPNYHGKSWLKTRLPRHSCEWIKTDGKSIAQDCTDVKSLRNVLHELDQQGLWQFPKRTHFFFSDLHGDPEAFAASLVSSGGVRKTGPTPTDFELTKKGQQSNFIIGGDCFDKGPSSLNLLRTIQHLRQSGARVRILAGNHDVRVLFGMMVVGQEKQTQNEHFFIRTGQKIIPLLKEIWSEYLAGTKAEKHLASKRKSREMLYPRELWFDDFREIAKGILTSGQIERETQRIRKKNETFEKKCNAAGLTLPMALAAVLKWKELFTEKEGEFYWFYRRMRIVYKSGSFLFLHAGLDNVMAEKLTSGGIKEMNRHFKAALFQDPFDFYYSPLCNMVRTKYRKVDHSFTRKGAQKVRRAGISALIHGHRNLHHGQRIALRNNVLHFECDTSLDSHTRKQEKVPGRGASCTIIDPRGQVIGISNDYPKIKVFDPIRSLKTLKKESAKHEKQ